MSIQSPKPYECRYCGGARSGGTAFCSEECRIRDRGEKLLRTIKHDHTLCSTCFLQLKEIYRPDPELCYSFRTKSEHIKNAFSGFQTLTPNADMGEFGTECQCGNVDHYAEENSIRRVEPYTWNLKIAIEVLKEKGKFPEDETFDIVEFADAFFENDLTFSLGKAVKS